MRDDDPKNEADELRASVGKDLRKMLSDIAAEPLPPLLARLVSRLDELPAASGARQAPVISPSHQAGSEASACLHSGVKRAQP